MLSEKADRLLAESRQRIRNRQFFSAANIGCKPDNLKLLTNSVVGGHLWLGADRGQELRYLVAILNLKGGRLVALEQFAIVSPTVPICYGNPTVPKTFCRKVKGKS